MTANNQVKQLCIKYFNFLEKEFNFKLVKQTAKTGINKLIYKTNAVGIILVFEPREFYLFVSLCKLINGDFPIKSGEIAPTTVINCFDLDDVVTLRSKISLVPDYASKNSYKSITLDELFKIQSENLRNFAFDIIQADFSIFVELDKIVKKRARQFAIHKWGDRAAEFGWSLTEERLT
jgi:hypothetical protein